STWVSRIVINRCLMKLRSARRARLAVNDALRIERVYSDGRQPLISETPEVQLGRHEIALALRRELSLIPQSYAVPLELHYLHEMSLADIAGQLGLTEAATKTRLHRGQGFLRERMMRHAGRRGVGTLTRVA